MYKGRPSGGVVGFTIAAVEGGGVGNDAFAGAAGKGVVYDGAGNSSRCLILDFIPFGAGEAHAGEALAAGENDAPILVVPGVAFILTEDGELSPVDRTKFVKSEAQGHCRQNVDLYEGLPSFIVRPEGAIALPFGRELGKFRVVQAGVILRPAFLMEGIIPAFLPKFGVVGCEAVEHEGTFNHVLAYGWNRYCGN